MIPSTFFLAPLSMQKNWLFDREAEASYHLLRENGLKEDTLRILEDFLFVFETRSKY